MTFFLSIAHNLFSFISGVGILQGFLLAALIYFHPKSDRTVTKFLSLYVVSISLIMALPLIFNLIGWQKSFFLEPFHFLSGPMIYLFIRSYKEAITWRKAIVHLVLFFISFFIYYWVFDGMARRFPDAKNVPEEVFKETIPILVIGVRFVQNFFYYFLSIKALNSYQKSIQHVFSDTSRINLKWVKWLINGYLLFVILTVLFYSFMLQFPNKFGELFLLNFALITPYIYLTTYKGITQPTIWQTKDEIPKMEMEAQLQYVNDPEVSGLRGEKPGSVETGKDVEQVLEILNRIQELMQKEKLYQEPELTIKDLAEKVRFPYYQVSQVINNELKKNFYDLVNSYRVEEAKRLLLDPKSRNFTILSVGFEAGFNSKTTFNTVFKKFTGLTPTEYRNKQYPQTQ